MVEWLVLPQLHWLPVKQRVVYRLAVLVFRSLRDFTPPCLADDYQLVADSARRHLDLRNCAKLGNRNFLAGGSASAKQPSTYPYSCDSLALTLDRLNDYKNILFVSGRSALVTFCFQCTVYKSIYLSVYLISTASEEKSKHLASWHTWTTDVAVCYTFAASHQDRPQSIG